MGKTNKMIEFKNMAPGSILLPAGIFGPDGSQELHSGEVLSIPPKQYKENFAFINGLDAKRILVSLTMLRKAQCGDVKAQAYLEKLW